MNIRQQFSHRWHKNCRSEITLLMVCTVSSASSKMAGFPSTSKHSFLIDFGVGEAANGYCLGSSSCKCLGALRIRGGNLVVVVVVVVTTVVCVAGP